MECCICKQPSKYTCPECSFKTCSLSCVKNHKFIYGCSGVSKPLKFVPVNELNENHLRKDMNFLLDIARVSDQSFKTVTKLSRFDNRKRFSFLTNECRAQGILLKLMPKSMSRHLSNTSLYDKSEKSILWQIEWKLNYNTSTISCQTTNNRDDSPIAELLSVAISKFKEDPLYVLEFGDKGGNFMVYFQTGRIKVNKSAQSQYIKLDESNTLKNLLPFLSQQAEIIEFPTLHLFESGSGPELVIN